MTARLLSLAWACAVTASGCAVVTTRGAPAQLAPSAPPACTTSNAAVYVDGTLSGAAVGTSLFLGLAALADSDNRSRLGYATLYTFLGGVGFSVSGVIGGVRVRSCRRAHEAWRATQPPPPPPQP
jgi:hypothetical protein